jgi:endonuclease YncB( thermonuclease family)
LVVPGLCGRADARGAGQYEFAEQEARARRAGLWAHAEHWRQAKREGANGRGRSMQMELLRR